MGRVLRKWLQVFIIFAVVSIAAEASAVGQKREVVSLSAGNKTVNYIYYHPSESVELKPVLAQGKVGKTESVAAMAKKHNAIAAINGTFFNAYDSRDLQPMGAVMINRDMKHYRGGPTAVGMAGDNTLQFLQTSSVKIYGGINGSRSWPNNWYAWFINHLPTSDGEIVVFTPEFRSSQVNASNFTFVIVSKGVVQSIRKHDAVIPSDGFVIAHGPADQNKDQVNKFKVGDKVEYYLDFTEGSKSLNHLLSAGPKLVTKGKADVNFQRENITDPKLTTHSSLRSFIGTKQDGTVVMGTVQGVTIKQLAEVLQKIGLTEAMNLDGGASSGLFYQGSYITSPGRNVSNSLVLVKKEKSPRIMINGEEIFFSDAKAYIENGTTMIPVRGVMESLGATVIWDGTNQRVIASRLDTEIVMTVGKLEATVNGVKKPLINAPANRGGRVYIPLRFVSESLGAQVGWNQQQYLVTITSDISTADVHYQKALDYIAQNKNIEAIAELELATKLDTDFSDAWIQLARLYSAQKDYNKTVYAYQQVYDERVFIPLGWAAYSATQYSVAADAFTKATNQSSTVVGGHYGLGLTYLHFSNPDRNLDKVKFHLQKVIELAPNSEQAKLAQQTLDGL